MEFQQRGAKVEEDLGGKRRATTEEWTSNKKRALSSNSDSPVAMNGMVDDKKKNSTTKEEEDGKIIQRTFILRLRHVRQPVLVRLLISCSAPSLSAHIMAN